MATDSKAILRKGVTIDQIVKAISDKYTDVNVHASSTDFMYVTFKDGQDQRQLAVSFSDSCFSDYGIHGVWCSLGMWGNSVEIIRYLCESFGGYIDENDCDDIGFYPINFHLYEKGTEFSQMDVFTHKVIAELGYDNLKKTLKLFEEFKQIV